MLLCPFANVFVQFVFMHFVRHLYLLLLLVSPCSSHVYHSCLRRFKSLNLTTPTHRHLHFLAVYYIAPNRFICRGSHSSLVAITSNSEVPQRLCRSCRQMLTKLNYILANSINKHEIHKIQECNFIKTKKQRYNVAGEGYMGGGVGGIRV